MRNEKVETGKVFISRHLKSIVLIVLCIAASVSFVFAAVLFSSHVKGNTDFGTGAIVDLENNALVAHSVTVEQAELKFSKAGDQVDFKVRITNNSDANLHYYYGVSIGAETAANGLSRAILVYYDGEFIDTLAHLCQNGEGRIDGDDFVMAKGNAAEESAEHLISFQLHIAAEASVFDKKSVDVKVISYTETADYQKYIFVRDDAGFQKAVDDINSGLLSDVTVVVNGKISLSRDYTILRPCTIDLKGNELDLNGKTLTLGQSGLVKLKSSIKSGYAALSSPGGEIVLDGASALLDIEDFYAETGGTNIGKLYAGKVSPTNYDKAAAAELVKSRFLDNIGGGIPFGGSVELGALYFYKPSVSVGNNCTYNETSGLLSAPASGNVTSVASLTITPDGGEAVTAEFKLIGSDAEATKNALLEAGGELYHIVTANNNAFDSVTSDLFLPKSIKSKNITIEWKSSDPATISDDGKISDSVTENREVSLYATIRVNSSVFTHTFSFRVTSQNNETKFAYLIAQLSPITLENVYSGSNKDDSFLYLPVVDAASAYDYRKNFATPTSAATQLNWSAYKDIRLEKIEYSVSNTYNYITVDKTGNERAVYLNTAVFYTYAQIEVTGKFQGDGTIYTGNVNVIIKLGENKDLNDLVFNYVDSRLQEIDVLQNILDTRLKYGLKNERGDFYLGKKYMTFSLSYSVPPASQGIISGIEETADGYWIKINPEGFYTSETEIGISVTIRLESSATNTETRILYFTVPPVLKPDDEGFSNLSVFNSVKYQVFSQLPEAEKSETTISDDVAARLALLPPYGANTRYETGFDINAGATILENTTKAYILLWDAERCSKLDFYIGETERETDNYEVYRLMLLLQWATGTEKKAANAVAEGLNLSGTMASVQSDGKEYLTPDEISVIKAYLNGIASSADWDAVWTEATEQAPGLIITNGAALNATIAEMIALRKTSRWEWVSHIGDSNDDYAYFKYVEILQWATNEKKYDDAGGGGTHTPPNTGIIGDGYLDDGTDYISETEARALKTYWQKATTQEGVLSNTFNTAFNSATITPTYLKTDGINFLAQKLYEALGKTASFFMAELTQGIPHVTNLDETTAGLSYFSALTALNIYGEIEGNAENSAATPRLSAFLNTSSLTSFINRFTIGHPTVSCLTMRNCAQNYVAFDIVNLARLQGLTYLDLSFNMGIKGINSLVDLNMAQLQYLNVRKINPSCTFEYQEYALSNLYANYTGTTAQQLYYSDDDGIFRDYAVEGRSKDAAESLTYLNEFSEIRSEYLQLCQQIYTDTGADEIYWRIESGNMMTLVTSAGAVPTIASVEGMNEKLANYYYCNATFVSGDGKLFSAGHIYKISYIGGSLEYTDCGIVIDAVYDNASSVPSQLTAEEVETAVSKDDYDELELRSSDKGTGTTKTRNNIISANGTSGSRYILYFYLNGELYDTIDEDNPLRLSGETSFGYDEVEYTVTNTYRKHKYTNVKELVSTKYYYYTGNSQNATIGGLNMSLIRNSVITCEYNYFNYSSGYYEYTETRREIYRDYYFTPRRGNKTYVKNHSEFKNCDTMYFVRGNNNNDPIGNNSLSNYTAYKINEATSSEYISGGLDESTATFVDLGETTVNAITKCDTYISNVGVLSSADKAKIDEAGKAAAAGNAYYQYTGNTGSGDIYAEATTPNSLSYTRNYYYRLGIGSDGYSWTRVTITLPSSTTTLDGILSEANSYINDRLYGKYYGMYYYYNGPTMTTALGNTYVQNGVYRLLSNESGQFYFEHDLEKMSFCTTITTIADLQSLALNATADSVGNVYYYTGASDRTYETNKFYILTVNETTGAYYMKRFGAVEAIADTNGVVRLDNERYYTGSNYGGTGGTHQVVISAIVRKDGKEYVRKFTVDVKG